MGKLKGMTIKGLTAYCMKTKEKGVTIINPTIHKTSRGGFYVTGFDENNNKLTTIIKSDKAAGYIKAGAIDDTASADVKGKKAKKKVKK